MAVEDVKAFFAKVEADQGLQAKLKELARKQEEQAEAELSKFAATAGFHFTAAELAQARAVPAKPPEELSQEELGKVAGGALASSAFKVLAKAAESNCCYWAQGCMPGFIGKS